MIGFEIYTADSVLFHPSYSPTGSPRYLNDLALVRFDKAIRGATWAEVNPATTGTACGTPSASDDHTYLG